MGVACQDTGGIAGCLFEVTQELFASTASKGIVACDGPHIYVEGVFRGREVYLQVLAYAPEDEEPGLRVDATPRRRRPE